MISPPRASIRSILRLSAHETPVTEDDALVVEEPLEIRVEGRAVAVTMRTPGHDAELAAGFLLTEGVISSRADLFDLTQCQAEDSRGNVIDALTAAGESVMEQLTRHVFTSSSCGICGKATIDSVFQKRPPLSISWSVGMDVIRSLPDLMREKQRTFATTGGLHAAALFHRDGSLIYLREDVGRHNAVDKVLGRATLDNLLPLDDHILLVSGRLSFELVQKAHSAGVPLLAAISAPSTLAVDLAREAGLTLIGFLRGERANCYAHPERVSNLLVID